MKLQHNDEEFFLRLRDGMNPLLCSVLQLSNFEQAEGCDDVRLHFA